MRGQTASTRGVEGTVFRALGDTAPVQGTHSWGRWRRQSQKEASRKSQEGMLIAFPAARGAVWRCSGQGPACRPRPAERTPQTALSIETAPEAQAEESAGGQLGHHTGSRAVLHGGPHMLGHGFCSLVSCRPPPWARGSPRTPQAAPAGLTPGSCYLCTMSLISFTELRSLLKS